MKTLKWIFAVPIALSLLLFPLARGYTAGQEPMAGVIYVDVDATGADDGTSWTDAYTDLQAALAASTSGTQIWVAEGVYYPDISANPKNYNSFVLKNGVELYGGFAATETALAQRDWAANLTILSGDIDHNDVNDDGNFIAETWSQLAGDNTYTIVYAPNVDDTAVLDGFIITAGWSRSSGPGDVGEGGGVYLDNASPTLRNLTFSGNMAYRGGGGLSVANNSNPALSDITFTGNYATLNGGGLFVTDASGSIQRATFSGNRADSGDSYGSGGGVHIDKSTFTLTDITISDNVARAYGGGIYVANSVVHMESATIGRNATLTHMGGGAHIRASTVGISDTVFISNTATSSGGGLYAQSGNVVVLTGTQFISNTAGTQGGGIYTNGTVRGTDVTLRGNVAASRGGGMAADQATVELARLTVENNTAQNGEGGGLVFGSPSRGSGTATLTDVAITGNTAQGTWGGGGGVALTAGSLVIRGGLIAHNAALAYYAGGIYMSAGYVALENVTISDNTAGTPGSGRNAGGIYHRGTNLTLYNVTIANNLTYGGQGGGLFIAASDTPLIMTNTILADNEGEDFRHTSSSTSAMSVTYSLVETQASPDLSDGIDGNLIGSDPMLDSLADNGGFSHTLSLLPGSPAVDAGTDTVCPPNDQRGVARPIDGDDDGTAACDMGAFEAPPGSGPISTLFIYLPLVIR